ncbi:MAG: glutamyl-tRNA reductase [Deltaproteobacteria bacterium]|nr:glutamyl-tRNA reductase [Deltaproteobacteria bacterium]
MPSGPNREKARIVIAGINHNTAPLELREKLSFSNGETVEAILELKSMVEIREVIIISTCNRMEVMMTADDPDKAVARFKAYLSSTRSMPPADFEGALYIHKDDEAVSHIFKVAASLDSMIVGEPQILGQLKQAYQSAVGAKGTGVILNRVMHKAFFTAKCIRSETGIGSRAVSISYAAVELAKKIFGRLNEKTILLIGAGEMAELAVAHLIHNHADGRRYIANRTFATGEALARRFNGQAIRFEEIEDTLVSADIIISSTGAPGFIINAKKIKPVMRARRNRPLFFIDIAVPRDIDPGINRIDNAYVYDIDDLNGVIDENMDARHKESIKAERIIDQAVIRFRQWYDGLDIVPTVKALHDRLSFIADAEIKRTLPGLDKFSETDALALKRMTEAMIKKFLHHPTLFLKNTGSHTDKALYLDITRRLFHLEPDE